MGIDTEIRISKDARIDDVAEVIGILSGLTPEWVTSSGASWVKVEGVKVEGIVNIPSCAEIYIMALKEETALVDGTASHFVMFHFQPSECALTHNLMIPPSTAYWIAVGLKLCKFFGGSVRYNDCDSLRAERYFKRPRKDNAPSDGKPWKDFQKEMFNLKPLTQKDLDRAGKVAAYKQND